MGCVSNGRCLRLAGWLAYGGEAGRWTDSLCAIAALWKRARRAARVGWRHYSHIEVRSERADVWVDTCWRLWWWWPVISELCALFLKASMLMLAGSCGWKFGRPRGYWSVEAHPAMRMPRRSEGIAPVRRSAETLLAHRVDFFASAFDLLGLRLTGKSRLRSLRKSEGGVQKKLGFGPGSQSSRLFAELFFFPCGFCCRMAIPGRLCRIEDVRWR